MEYGLSKMPVPSGIMLASNATGDSTARNVLRVVL